MNLRAAKGKAVYLTNHTMKDHAIIFDGVSYDAIMASNYSGKPIEIIKYEPVKELDKAKKAKGKNIQDVRGVAGDEVLQDHREEQP